MSYRTIAVQVNESLHNLNRIKLAAALAGNFEAHLIGTAASGVPEWFTMPGMVAEPGIVLTSYLESIREQARSLLAEFEAAAARAGVASFESRMIEQDAAAALCLQARYSDLLVIGQGDPNENLPSQSADIAQQVALNSPRAVLIIPFAGMFQGLGKRAMIAWDGSMAAARAVTAALPFLRRAESVQVAVFNPDRAVGAHGASPGADIALFLARHGVKVEVSVNETGDELDAGNALLSHLSDWNADLLVMGCYGHSRFREILLGGVSRTVMESMTVPVLMEH
ncbi:MAG: universal stress protein [Herminiimonas sp.]|nr:universal stress protein [Herminiimonas sp.]